MTNNNDLNSADHQRALLVRLELGEVVARLEAEGIDKQAVLAGMAALVNDYVAGATNQATASAYFFGLAKHAAHLASDQIDRGEL